MSSLLPTTPTGATSGAELFTSDGRSLALVSAKLRGEIQGGIARLVLEQRFANHHEENLRVTYRMPLPADGAVSGYEFEIGDRAIKGVVDKKAQARERFERAIVQGRTAALLEQERADIFTQQIGNIPPRESVLARITVDQRLVWLPEGEWELRFPTVIGPRYIGSADTAADVRATHIKVTDKPLSASIQIELAIRDRIVGGGKPSSPSHQLEQRADGFTELKSGSRLDRDIVVRWPVAAAAPGLTLATARPANAADAFALLTIVPPAPSTKPVAVPRDLLVLLDTSGSMSGGPLEKAQQVVAMMIDSLDEQDRFELIEFNNDTRRYLDEPQVATAKAKAAAIKWVRSRVADGGTEMRAAVIESLATLRVGAQRQVVIVTDGYVGGERQILEALNRRLPKSCRLHVLGVGSAVNRSLATALARAGRGTEVIVGIDEDAERGAKRLLDRTTSPMLTNVEISGSALLRHAPEKIPDVFEGAPLVAALAIRPDGGELVVRGQLARDAYEQRITVKPQFSGEGNQAICALYGRERVADVEANALFGSVDGEIEDLGLTFQIATRMTSWVAIDEARRVTGPSRDELVPQELPYGTTASAFGLRGAPTAAGGYAPQARTMLGMAMPASRAEGTARLQAVMDEEGDFGEEAPAEVFGEHEGTAPSVLRAFEPSDALRSRSVRASYDDERSLGASYEDEGSLGADADFEHEEVTGQTDFTQKEVTQPTGRESFAAAPREARRADEPAAAPEPAPAPARTMMLGSAAPPSAPGMKVGHVEPLPSAQPMPGAGPGTGAPMPDPKTMELSKRAEEYARAKAPSSRLPWMIAAVILALVAFLLWWLLG